MGDRRREQYKVRVQGCRIVARRLGDIEREEKRYGWGNLYPYLTVNANNDV